MTIRLGVDQLWKTCGIGGTMKYVKSRYGEFGDGLHILWCRNVFITDLSGYVDDNNCQIISYYTKREIFGYDPKKVNVKRWKRVYRRMYTMWSGGGE